MNKIKIEDLNNFKFLSNMNSNEEKDKFVYILSRVNIEKDRYEKSIYMYDGKEHTFLAKESNYAFLDNDNIYFISDRDKDEKEKFDKTKIYLLSLIKPGEAKKIFEFDFKVNKIYKLNDDMYLLSMTYNRDIPYLYKMSIEDKENEYKNREKFSFREEIDELPFWIDNSTYIRKEREGILIYIPSKNEYVEILDFNGDDIKILDVDRKKSKILISKNAFNLKMELKDTLIEYDYETKELTLISDKEFSISNAKYGKNNIYMLATNMKKLGINENNLMYKIDRDNKEISIYIDDDISYGNSTGSDVRLGSNNEFYVDYDSERILFISTNNYKSVLNEVIDGKVNIISEDLSSVDGFTYLNNKLYLLGYLGSKLCEIYEKDTLNAITEYNKYALNDKYITHPIEIKFNSNGDEISGFVLLPYEFDTNKKYKAILDIHGGPKTVYGINYYHEMQVWASLGYVVMFTNPHGSSGRGNEFSDIRGKYGSIDYEDLMNFVDVVLEKFPNISKEDLGVTGGSYGGFMTNWIITHTNRFKAAVTQRSISNWISMYGVSDIGYYFSDDQNATLLPNEKGFEKIWNHSPLKYIENVKTPTLIIHSDKDYRCPIDQGYQLFTALRDRKIDTKMILFKNESHGLSRGGKPSARILRLKEITNWFIKYLGE